jgi:N utilization substance protein A
MNADFLAVLEFWEREKGINRDVLSAAVQEALLSAAKKAVGPARELRVVIDQKSGDIRAFAKLVVSEKVISKHDQITVFDARRIKPEAQVGDEVEVEVTPVGFGRIAAQYAKQALMQHIRRAEKAREHLLAFAAPDISKRGRGLDGKILLPGMTAVHGFAG